MFSFDSINRNKKYKKKIDWQQSIRFFFILQIQYGVNGGYVRFINHNDNNNNDDDDDDNFRISKLMKNKTKKFFFV